MDAPRAIITASTQDVVWYVVVYEGVAYPFATYLEAKTWAGRAPRSATLYPVSYRDAPL
jgi:hypothetical protein